jgi:PPOX class probable F420-dependent enzyme
MGELTIPAAYFDLLEGPHTAILTTLFADGSPQASPVWFIFDGTSVRVSTRVELAKHRNVQRDPRVAFTIVDPARPLRYIEIRGVVTIASDDDYAVRDAVVHKHGYADASSFDPPGQRRAALTIVPTRIIEH